MEAVVRVLAPESLILSERNKPQGAELRAADDLAKALQPGDIILVLPTQTQTPGRTYKLLRALSLSYFDHVSVFLNEQETLQVGPPRVRLLPSCVFLTMRRKPFVIRLRPDLREGFLAAVQQLQGQGYSHKKALFLWSNIVIYEKTGVAVRTEGVGGQNVICTDSILGSIPQIHSFIDGFRDELDFFRFGSFSINDFLLLMQKGLFTEVELPFPYSLSNQQKDLPNNAKALMKKQALRDLAHMFAGWSALIQQLLARKPRHKLQTKLLMVALSLYLDAKQLPFAPALQAVRYLTPRL